MMSCVEVVLRSHAELRDVEAASWIISSFLGPPPNMTLSEACSTGCHRLLDWMWASSCTSVADRLPQWTLTNYLRSDPHYCRYQFSKSLQIAAARGDLVVLKCFFAHFSGCEVSDGAVVAAVRKGHLAVVQFLWASSAERYLDGLRCAKKRRTETRFWTNKTYEPLGVGHGVRWGARMVLFAAESGQYGMVRWLCENTLKEKEKRQGAYDGTLERALSFGDDDLVTCLLPPGRCVLDYAKNCPRLEVIESLLDCGYLQRDAESAVCAIKDLAGTGHLELMQRIALLHSPLREDCSNWQRWSSCWVRGWFDALHKSCKRGELESVQWLIQYPICKRVCEMIEGYIFCDNLVSAATAEGHWKTVQYLCEQKITENYMYYEPLLLAIRKGQLKCVEVLIHQYMHAKQHPDFSPIDVAAKYGRLAIVQFLHNFKPQDALADQRHPDLSAREAWWSQSRQAIFEAAASGHLEVLKWLHAHRSEDCGTTPMDVSARAGHLDVVKWLHYNRREGCTKSAIDSAATNGHLPVAQWLHTNRDEGCASDTMDMAAMRGHLDVVKWFCANTSDTCSAATVKHVFQYGPLRVASWLRTHFLEHTPVKLNEERDAWRGGIFERLLFLDAHCPHYIDRKFAEDRRQFILRYDAEYADAGEHTLNWLEAKCPSMDPSQPC